MLQMLAGLLIAGVAAVAASGALRGFVALPPIGLLVYATVAVFGLVIAAHGYVRRRRRLGTGEVGFVRKVGVAGWALVILAAAVLAMPAVASTLNLIQVNGFPLGFYWLAQGLLLVLAMLLFYVAAKQDAIDRDEAEPGESSTI
jgi:putative solute:sodium symporter small subunit